VLRCARATIVVTDLAFIERIARLASTAGVRIVMTIDEVAVRGTSVRRTPGRAAPEVALLQFTSGSSGPSRGVRVTFDALQTNVSAIRAWLRWSEDDPFSSWLPVYHDMGLIGAVVCSVAGGNDLWLFQPEQFIRRPARYVRCFGVDGARLTVMPNFGLEYIAR